MFRVLALCQSDWYLRQLLRWYQLHEMFLKVTKTYTNEKVQEYALVTDAKQVKSRSRTKKRGTYNNTGQASVHVTPCGLPFCTQECWELYYWVGGTSLLDSPRHTPSFFHLHHGHLNILHRQLESKGNSGCLVFNPLTHRSDQHVTSPNNIHTLSSKKVMRILKLIR